MKQQNNNFGHMQENFLLQKSGLYIMCVLEHLKSNLYSI